MANSRKNKGIQGAAHYTHALKEYSNDGSMLGGIRKISNESYIRGYWQGVLDTLFQVFRNNWHTRNK